MGGCWEQGIVSLCVCVFSHIYTLLMFRRVLNTPPLQPLSQSSKFNVKRATMLWPTNPATKQPMHSRHTSPLADSWPLPTIPSPPPHSSSSGPYRHMSLTCKRSHSSLSFLKVRRAGNNTLFFICETSKMKSVMFVLVFLSSLSGIHCSAFEGQGFIGSLC